jgi:hypothetical protein
MEKYFLSAFLFLSVCYVTQKNLPLTRLGLEFETEITKGWGAGIALMWDEKWGYYDSWIFEFSFSKTF